MDHLTDSPEPRIVTAAGGLVLDGEGAQARVLVVHRPAYDDWTLPKGHVDPGEQIMTAAVREVQEETGVRSIIVSTLGATTHPVGETLKRVHWFLMRLDADSPAPQERAADAEVDIATWWSLAEAAERLTYPSERDLLMAASVA